MTDSDVLQQTLGKSLTCNRARLKLLTRLILAVLQVRSVNLARLAAVMAGHAVFDSRYRQLRRFMRHFELPFDELTRLLVRLTLAKPPFILVLDRTEWKIRGVAVNVLVLSLWQRGICHPVLWHVISKSGSTSHTERIALLDEFERVIGFGKVRYLLGDREFHGRKFYNYLRARGLKFRLRVRSDTAFTGADGRVVRGRELTRGLAIGVTVKFRRAQMLWGSKVRVWAKRLSAEETLMVVAPAEGRKSELFAEYGERWRIEELFEAVKSRGFCLEATRISEPERLRRLIAVVAIAFIWAVRIGELHLKRHPAKRKTDGRRTRSVFRVGLDELTQMLSHQADRRNQARLREAVQILSGQTKRIMRL